MNMHYGFMEKGEKMKSKNIYFTLGRTEGLLPAAEGGLRSFLSVRPPLGIGTSFGGGEGSTTSGSFGTS